MDEEDLFTEVADLRVLLRDIPGWRLPTASWPGVEEALRAAQSALGARDASQLRNLVADLELFSPLRVQARPGTAPLPTPAPEEINMLVHDIGLNIDTLGDERNRLMETRDSDGDHS